MQIQHLANDWTLTCAQENLSFSCSMPVEVHQVLLDNNLLPHPYDEQNEEVVQWVAEKQWQLETTLEITVEQFRSDFLELNLESVDTVADIYINDQCIRRVSNQFARHTLNISEHVTPGLNKLTIQLIPAAKEARQRAKKLPFPIPYSAGNNNKIPHMNTLRKTQCHAGWDWGICLMITGIYQTPTVSWGNSVQINHVTVTQHHTDNQVKLCLDIDYTAYTNQTLTLSATVDEYQIETRVDCTLGQGKTSTQLIIDNPKLWWPAGYGDQPLFELEVQLDSAAWRKTIGLRKMEVVTEPDNIGSGLIFRVNNVDIFCKGANWIPADALTLETTNERYETLLQSAVDANMNMIRVWGGGMYERDAFYNQCDELGLLIWQDLMFACSLYPSTPEFIDDVSQEVEYQTKRLAHHASLAMWCGDNEVIGALNWYPESRENRERYVVNYDRLNRSLQHTLSKTDPSRRFWPSSPCNGELDYGDAWHDDSRGDIHFWDVWHSGKSFSAYYDVQPRFCSEFGFQSFPSMNTIRSFATEDQLNLTSPVMESHQKNNRGNSIMTEMLTRYFRFPTGFENTVYLSQAQQAVAIKSAVEYWRSLRPICMGAVYWQLNDNWPVASWSSLEHSGQWKQLHYHAKRFFAPLLVTLSPTDDKSHWQLIAVNDNQTPTSISGSLTRLHIDGCKLEALKINETVKAGQAQALLQLTHDQVHKEATTSFWVFESDDGALINTFYFAPWKKMNLPKTHVSIDVRKQDHQIIIELNTDAPAHFVTLETKDDTLVNGHFSDNSITLLPDSPKLIHFHGEIASIDAFKHTLTVNHLWKSYQ